MIEYNKNFGEFVVAGDIEGCLSKHILDELSEILGLINSNKTMLLELTNYTKEEKPDTICSFGYTHPRKGKALPGENICSFGWYHTPFGGENFKEGGNI